MSSIKKKRLIDGLPAATKKFMQDQAGNELVVYEDGFALGSEGSKVEGGEKGKYYLNNHVDINLLYHFEKEGDLHSLRIVGFEVSPKSVQHDTEFSAGQTPKTCPVQPGKPISVSDGAKEVVWSYSVKWEESNVKWALRWDVYLKMRDNQIHWFSIVNSLMIVLFLSGMLAMIVMRTVHADFKRYRELETQEEAQEETGWKLVHGDVFRPPQYGMFLSALVGTGLQVLSMILITMGLSLLFLSTLFFPHKFFFH